MGNRLSKIITRTGDDGTTGLGNGGRIAKDAPRMEVIGQVDLLNSQLGLAVAALGPEAAPLAEVLNRIQHDLFDLGAQLSVPGTVLLGEAHLARVEADAARLNAALPPLKEFILPGGGLAGSTLQIARAIARGVERRLVGLANEEGGFEGDGGASFKGGMRYLNRLSDLLFIAARSANAAAGIPETLWQRGASAGQA